MGEGPKKPGVAFWTTVNLTTILLYALSIGPACWLSSRTNVGASVVSQVYRPLTWGMSQSEKIANAINSYSEFGSADSWSWGGGEAWRRWNRLNVNRGKYHDEWEAGDSTQFEQ
jgi:hypothetical protein